jgi:hypothetical protein
MQAMTTTFKVLIVLAALPSIVTLFMLALIVIAAIVDAIAIGVVAKVSGLLDDEDDDKENEDEV